MRVRFFIERAVVVLATEQDDEYRPHYNAQAAAKAHNCSEETIQLPQCFSLLLVNPPPPQEHGTADDAARARADDLRSE